MPSKKPDTFDALSKTLTGVIAGIQANLSGTRQVPMGGQSVTLSSVIADFQSFVDKNTEVDAAKANTQTLIDQRKELKTTTKKKLKDFMKWLELQFGVKVFGQYGLPQPSAHTTSPAKQAIAIEKRKAKAKAKKEALDALAPAEEKLVAYDASGQAINAEPTAPVTPAVPPASTK